ncbi:MAG: COG4705 family protein [Chthoniobacterales bacterium]
MLWERDLRRPEVLSKVPEVTFIFWLIKICATTLGETGGDALSMTLKLGYAVSTGIFFAIFLGTALAQVAASSYHRFRYWAVIVTTTTVGTTMSDYLTRSAGLGYLRSSILLFAMVLATLAIWRFTLGSVSVNRIANRKMEAFYWMTILFSNTLGTALGDCVADTTGLGYEGGALVFFGALALVAVVYFWTGISHTALFWSAFILTRPLGATLGDLLTKPISHGGLHLGRIASSLVIAAFIVVAILFSSREAGQHPGGENTRAAGSQAD